MFNFRRMLGIIWAAPVTAIGLTYVTLFTVFNWYRRLGTRGDALVWQLNVDKSPSWLNKIWSRRTGQTLGNVVVLRHDTDAEHGRMVLRHEQEHVRQFMVLGIFQPILYYLISFVLRFCRHAHPRYDNPLEIDARRAAGQVIDVVGAVGRAYVNGTLKLHVRKRPE